MTLRQASFSKAFVNERDRAWAAFGLYWEHDWTADKKELPRAERAAWQRRIAQDITGYVDHLDSASSDALGRLIRRTGDAQRFFVFNPLGWRRDDVADLPYVGDQAVHVIDLTTGESVPSQFIHSVDAQGVTRSSLQIFASRIPSLGYKVFEVEPGIAAPDVSKVTASGNELENDFYRVRLDGRGAIESIVSKALNGREMAARIDDRFVNDFGAELSDASSVTVTNEGPVSVTLRVETTGALPRSTEVTLFQGLDRIAIRNEIKGNFSDVKTWAFSFNLHGPDVWHEEVGAINHARLQPEGDYAARFSKLDWLTLNHFVSMTGDDGSGVTISNSDDAFMELGHSDISKGVSTLDTTTPKIDVLAGGQVDGRYLGIQDQDGDRHFVQRFAVRAQSRPSAAQSMRFALEDQNPLVAGKVTGGKGYPETTYSLLSSSNPDVMLWALKPAEEGIDHGIVARFWNLTPASSNYSVKFSSGIASARSTTHIETFPKSTPLVNDQLHVRANSWQLQSFELSPSTASRKTK